MYCFVISLGEQTVCFAAVDEEGNITVSESHLLGPMGWGGTNHKVRGPLLGFAN